MYHIVKYVTNQKLLKPYSFFTRAYCTVLEFDHFEMNY